MSFRKILRKATRVALAIPTAGLSLTYGDSAKTKQLLGIQAAFVGSAFGGYAALAGGAASKMISGSTPSPGVDATGTAAFSPGFSYSGTPSFFSSGGAGQALQGNENAEDRINPGMSPMLKMALIVGGAVIAFFAGILLLRR
jgi:hypothetical protein